MKTPIVICPSALNILCIKDAKKRQKEWDKLIKIIKRGLIK